MLIRTPLMCPLHAPYMPPMCPYIPPTCPYAPLCTPYAPLCTPMHPLCTPTHPYMPLYTPMHPLCAPTHPLCTPYVPFTCDEYQMLWIFRIFPLYSLYNSRMLLANEFIQSGTTYAPLRTRILFLIS